jgi:hypothetical protein
MPDNSFKKFVLTSWALPDARQEERVMLVIN